MNATDFDTWETYVRAELARFYELHTEGVTYLFANTARAEKYLARQAKRGHDSELAAFAGPWHVVRHLVTTEFRQWVEEHEATERFTPSQWVARSRAERADIAWHDSAEVALDRLTMLRREWNERDAMIMDAARKGAPKAAIARAIGLSRQYVHAVLARVEATEVPDFVPGDWETPASWDTTPF